MSITGFDLRKRLRRQVVRALDALLERLEREEREEPTPATAPVTPPAPAPVVAPPPPAPLPELPPRTAPLGAQRVADTVTVTADRADRPARTAPRKAAAKPERAPSAETEAGARARVSPEDRQKAHWDRTRRGILRFVADQGGRAGLRELHDHSERTYFVAHVGFSRLMEELTAEGLLDYDHDTAVATLTDAGKAAAD
jgi:hypothetical protein